MSTDRQEPRSPISVTLTVSGLTHRQQPHLRSLDPADLYGGALAVREQSPPPADRVAVPPRPVHSQGLLRHALLFASRADEMHAFLRHLRTRPPSVQNSAPASSNVFCHDPSHAAPPPSLLCCSPWTRRCLSISFLRCRRGTIQWLAIVRPTCAHNAHSREPCSVLIRPDAHLRSNRVPSSVGHLRRPTETLRGGRQ